MKSFKDFRSSLNEEGESLVHVMKDTYAPSHDDRVKAHGGSYKGKTIFGKVYQFPSKKHANKFVKSFKGDDQSSAVHYKGKEQK